LASVMADVRPDMSMVPMFQAASMVIVPVTLPLSVNTAVSCARGKFATAGVPVEVVAQPVADQFCAPARFQYTVLGVENVMPELPPQLPPLEVAVIALSGAPMSRKAALLSGRRVRKDQGATEIERI